MPGKLLSKTKYISGLQCARLLWISVNDKKSLPPTDPVTQYIFDQGHEIGELAKQLYPGGYDIPDEGFIQNIQETREAMKRRIPIFEAGIMADNLYARADVLNPVGDDEWDIIEVKSSTSIKEVNLNDVAFQKFCYQRAGLQVRNCYLAYIDKEYVKQGEVSPKDLFVVKDISEEVSERLPGVSVRVEMMQEMMAKARCPEAVIGSHCQEPYTCGLMEQCWSFLPEHNIFTLCRGPAESQDLFNDGVLTVAEIPGDVELNDKQKIQVEAVKSGETHLNLAEIRSFLESLVYPVYYLDFETFAPAVPLYDGMRPYQRVPFQYSLHVVAQPGDGPVHFSFLMEDTDDPRQALLAGLKAELGDRGSVVVYYQEFEQGVFRELAEAFPAYAEWCDLITARMVDLFLPFGRFDYYHLSQLGSASLKKVMPALTGKGYSGLEISEGGAASIRFSATTFGDASPGERQKLREALEIYCGRDSEGMIWIVEALEKLVRGEK